MIVTVYTVVSFYVWEELTDATWMEGKSGWTGQRMTVTGLYKTEAKESKDGNTKEKKTQSQLKTEKQNRNLLKARAAAANEESSRRKPEFVCCA